MHNGDGRPRSKPGGDAAIEAVALTAGYGRMAIVRDISLAAAPGELVVLLGPNGAGKSTTLSTLAGCLPLLSGEVRVNGRKTTEPLHRRARNGIAFVPEDRGVIRSLTVRDNIRLSRGEFADVLEYFPELRKRLQLTAGLLSGGEQQMLCLGRALSRRPSVLLLDELSLGLAPAVVTRLHEVVRRVADHGAAVILVEQHVRKVLQVADRGYVMNRGKIVTSGTSAELRGRLSEIENVYLSRDERLQ
jgi:branched-chain amino acid transport system ATP-binding protein